MSNNKITQRIVQYFEDPKESNALAKIKEISDQAKNKSSINLIHINQDKNELDTNTEINTALNNNMFKDNDKNTFQRRKHHFVTQKSKSSIADDIKKKANLKNYNELYGNEEEKENDTKRYRNKHAEKRVNFTINNKPKNENNSNNPTKKYDSKTYNTNTKSKDDTGIHNISMNKKASSDDSDIIIHRIVRYFENPKESNALAEIKRISNQAKNKTSRTLIHITPESINTNNVQQISNKFKRRKFQFPTTVYIPRKNNLTLVKELNAYKKKKNEEKDSDRAGSEDDESEDSIFDLDKKIKEEKETKEENKPKEGDNKERKKIEEKYKKIEITPKKEREKYSSSTYRNDYYVPRVSYRYDTISEEYKKRNNLTVEKINNKEKIIKNEYHNKGKGKNHLKTYKTEYFWDHIINRLVEKRIYTDKIETTKPVNVNKYSNNTFNPFVRYKNDFENRENENNVTQEKIELDSDNKNSVKKENSFVNDNSGNKKFVYSRKYKYMPHLYNSNTFNPEKSVQNNNTVMNNPDESKKPILRKYEKRQIISPKDEMKYNDRANINDQQNKDKYVKRLQKKEIEVKKKIIFPPKENEIEKNETKRLAYRADNKFGNTKKNEEIKYQKIVQPYSSNNNNIRKKNIRQDILSEKSDLFKEDQKELNNNINRNNLYSKYIKNKRQKETHIRTNRSELIEDLEKIEQYSINTHLKNDLLNIYNTINEESPDLKDVFNINLNDFEIKMGKFDKKKKEDQEEILRKNNKFNVKDLCKGKTTINDTYTKYKKRAIKIKRGTYNN